MSILQFTAHNHKYTIKQLACREHPRLTRTLGLGDGAVAALAVLHEEHHHVGGIHAHILKIDMRLVVLRTHEATHVGIPLPQHPHTVHRQLRATGLTSGAGNCLVGCAISELCLGRRRTLGCKRPEFRGVGQQVVRSRARTLTAISALLIGRAVTEIDHG